MLIGAASANNVWLHSCKIPYKTLRPTHPSLFIPSRRSALRRVEIVLHVLMVLGNEVSCNLDVRIRADDLLRRGKYHLETVIELDHRLRTFVLERKG